MSERETAPECDKAKRRGPTGAAPGAQASSRRGVTIVELLCVLALLGILTTLSFGAYSAFFRESPPSAEARKIQKTFATARSYAIAESAYYQVTFWLDKPSYWIDEVQASDPADPTAVAEVIRRQVIRPESVDPHLEIPDVRVGSRTFESGIHSVRFFPDGTSDDASVFLVPKSADKTKPVFYKIKLYGPTGRARVFDKQEHS